jgi:hypothetical protein
VKRGSELIQNGFPGEGPPVPDVEYGINDSSAHRFVRFNKIRLPGVHSRNQ